MDDFKMFMGDKWLVYEYDESQTTNNTIEVGFKTPASANCIMTIYFSSYTGGKIIMAEDATFSRNYQGTQTCANIIAMRRQETQSSGILNNGAQTDYNAGNLMCTYLQSLVNTTEIFRMYNFGKKMEKSEPIALKKSTIYSVQATALAPGNKSFFMLTWYEDNLEEN